MSNKIVAALVRRFNLPRAKSKVIKSLIPGTFEEWGKLRILPAGDLIRTSRLGEATENSDRRSASFVRVSDLEQILWVYILKYVSMNSLMTLIIAS